jgi:hypothetical protein
MMLECDVERASRVPAGSALAVSAMTNDSLDACVRLVRLLLSPHDIPVLGSLLEREILYRLLRGEQSTRRPSSESRPQQLSHARR